MPETKYIDIKISGREVEVSDISDLPLAISYKLENSEDFQKVTSSMATDIEIPATLQNDIVANSFSDPASEDLTPGQEFKSHQEAVITAGGTELLKGKAFLKSGTHDSRALGYTYSFYGNNGDWIIDLKEKTLHDFVKHLTFTFDLPTINASWSFTGTSEALPYVFAPVRYRGFMDIEKLLDDNVSPTYLRPSLSVYWVLFWAFKSLGYRIESTFLNTDYARRLVMPWTWGNFLDSDGTALELHKFLAMSDILDGYWFENVVNEAINLQVTNDFHDGGFDNNDEYSFVQYGPGGDRNGQMQWEYKVTDFGSLDATFSCQIQYDAALIGANSFVIYRIRWYHKRSGVETLFKTEKILEENGNNLAKRVFVDITTKFATRNVILGDQIIVRLYVETEEGSGIGAEAHIKTSVMAFQLEYFRIPLGGTINFENFPGMKKHKILDFIGGVFDLFDMNVSTDVLNKVVFMEPSHDYSLTNNLAVKSGGYFNNDFLDWTSKKDLSETWKMDLYSEYEREVMFRYKEDSNDGLLKKLQDRNTNILAAGKYVLPSRFKAGNKDFTNRFFSACVHYDNPSMESITGIAPQFVAIVPENISNTSNSEASNTFAPKICYYKGNTFGVGGWRFNGTALLYFPYMFAVNYKPGGENDPVLSYGDESIGAGNVVAYGLMKRFFWQRLAIMRNGQWYSNTFFRLNNNDVSKPHHREFKIVDGQKYELVEIEKYKPLKDESTACFLRKWSPITQTDFTNSFPSEAVVEDINAPVIGFDIKYTRRIALNSDIPT